MNFSEGQSPSQEQYLANINLKMADNQFTGDTIGLIRVDDEWDPKVVSNLVKEKIMKNFN